MTAPPYNSPSHFCLGDLSSCLAIDRVKDGEAGQRRLIRINAQLQQKQSVEEVHVFTEQELEMLHPLDKAVQTCYIPLLETFYIASSSGGFYQFNVTTQVNVF